MKSMKQCLAAILLLPAAGNSVAQSVKTDTLKVQNLKRIKLVVKDENTARDIVTGPIDFRIDESEMPPKGIRVPAPAMPANLPPLNHWTSARDFPCDTCLVWVMDPNKPSDSATAYRLIVNPRFFEFKYGEEEEIPLPNNDEAKTIAKRSIFSLGFTRLEQGGNIGPRMPALNTAKSVSCYIGFMEGGLKLDRAGHLRIWSGLGFESDNYRFDNPAVRLRVLDTLLPIVLNTPYFGLDTSGVASKKSKLVSEYLTIPLMIGIHQKRDPSKGFNMLIGCHFGYRLKSHAKYVFENGGREKWRNNFSLNDWKVSPYAEFGYKDVRFYVKYNMNPLFIQNGVLPAGNQLTFGGVFVFS